MSADQTLTTAEPQAATLLAAGETQVGLDLQRVPGFRPLATEYARAFDRLAALYPGNPQSESAWRDTIARVQAAPREPDAIAGVIAAQQARRGAPAAARDAAAHLANPRAVAIVTGQQAGLLGGPMYTLLKALTALQLARKVAAETGATVVPVFWVDAEDHDWDEIAHCTILGADHLPRTIDVPALDGAGERPAGSLVLDDGIGAILDQLEASLPRTDFTPGVLASLRAAYQPGRGVGEAFAIWIEGLLGPHGLVVYESSDKAAKPIVAEIFAREIETAGRTAELAAEGGQRMAAAGHAPQVDPQSDGPALFHLNHARTPIKRDGDSFGVDGQPVTREALAAEARREPWHFSPNVLLRPVVQDTLFPTIAYVAGPSELAYWGQLRGVYGHFDRPMPLVYPRATATLLDTASARFFRKHPVDLRDLQPQDDAALNRLLEAQLPPSVDAALRHASAALEQSFKEIARVVPEVDPTLAGAAQTTLRKVQHDLEALHGKVIQAAKRRDETLRRQFQRVQAQVFPQGHLQERTLGVVWFANQYGPALVDTLLASLPIEPGKHWLIVI